MSFSIKNFFRFEGEPVVVTGAGNYGDEEALLRWRRDKSSVSILLKYQLKFICFRDFGLMILWSIQALLAGNAPF